MTYLEERVKIADFNRLWEEAITLPDGSYSRRQTDDEAEREVWKGFPAWDSDTGISTYGPWRRNAAARTAQSGWMTCAPPTITRLTACSQQNLALAGR